MTINELLIDNSKYTEKILEEALSQDNIGNNGLSTAMRYAVLGGGKRIRAFLVRYFCKMFGGTDEMSKNSMCALEMIHAYSLVHDDLPAMDNDLLRRGQPSCHAKFGEANALLAGDALLTYAFEYLSRDEYLSSDLKVLSIKELSLAAGSLGMCKGQYFDLNFMMNTYSELLEMQNGKTGALIKASCLLGYYASGAKIDKNVILNISKYAHNIGLAFQIIDDILDVISDSETLGKPIGSDDKNGKVTVLSFMNIEEAKKEAIKLTNEAIEVIKEYDTNGIMCDLANMLLERKK